MTDITTSKPASGEGMKFFRRFLKRKTVAAGVIVLAIFVLLAVLAPWIAPYSPSKLSIVNRLKPPSELYWFGTDEFGRDVFSRTIFAARLSLLVGAAVVTLSALIGVTLGLLAGFFKRLDTPIARLIDAMMAFPDILLAIALVAALGPSLTTVIIAAEAFGQKAVPVVHDHAWILTWGLALACMGGLYSLLKGRSPKAAEPIEGEEDV